jgi:hypothetical protein
VQIVMNGVSFPRRILLGEHCLGTGLLTVSDA